MANKTKIIATIGPSCRAKTVLKKMISAGMNVSLLSFSHGDYQEHKKAVDLIRSPPKEINKPSGILLDLQGPKFRAGNLKNHKPVKLTAYTKFKIPRFKMSSFCWTPVKLFVKRCSQTPMKA